MNTIGVCVLLLLLLCQTGRVSTQDPCFNEYSSENGTCISILDCESAKEIVKKGGNPQNCGYKATTPLVCCVENAKIAPTRVSRKSTEKCKEYGEEILKLTGDDCENMQPVYLIIGGGVRASPNEFPHMVALGYQNEGEEIVYVCGGSLISRNFVLTAAHCIYSVQYGSPKTIRIGDFDLNSKSDDAEPQEIKIAKIHRHPDYKRPAKYNDIALLELEKDVKFSASSHPACLPEREQIRDSTTVLATGWGNTNAWGDKSDALLKVEINVINHENCSSFFQPDRKLPKGISKQTHICAGTANGGKDTCSGDSGGPLQIAHEKYCTYVIVGLTSFGKPCLLSPAPGVYTKVYAYLDWIESIVWP